MLGYKRTSQEYIKLFNTKKNIDNQLEQKSKCMEISDCNKCSWPEQCNDVNKVTYDMRMMNGEV